MAVAESFTGARAMMYLNLTNPPIGMVPVGWAAGVGGEEVVDFDPISVIGMLEIKEHAPVAYRVGLTAQAFRLVGSPLKDFGPNHVPVFPKEKDILTTDTMDAVIIDSLTNKVTSVTQGVKASGHTWDITARGVVAENISFVAIRTKDESEII